MKLQVLVKQLSNCTERPHESKNNWQPNSLQGDLNALQGDFFAAEFST